MSMRILFITALIAIATATQSPDFTERDIIIEGRQKLPGIPDEQCQKAVASAQSIYTSLPTPPPALLSMSLPSDPCATSIAFSGDAAAASKFSSYTSKVMDWYTSHSAQLQSALAPCSSLASFVAQEIPVCTSSVSSSFTTGSGATPTSTGSSSVSPSSATTGAAGSSSTAAPNAAPRETGFIGAAAVAAMGFVGAIAAL
ncbi:hypothetical protein GGS26DRAFT_307000 [Hypomontagnella submonticulosa]|nr:hypothetical protein GGS26DRAFT_307000 [Hypomontagnella submonticulosa]